MDKYVNTYMSFLACPPLTNSPRHANVSPIVISRVRVSFGDSGGVIFV